MRFPPSRYLDLRQAPFADLFDGVGEVWEAIPKIAPYLQVRLAAGHGIFGRQRGTAFIADNVHVGKGTIISPHVTILGPAWIGENCYIAPGCYIRENTLVGNNVIMGNACEYKNCLIFNRAETPHWNYVGDSILGYKAHLGAGVILSNFRLDHGKVEVLDPDHPGEKIATGLEKFGAIIGDEVDIGSNAVISPGSIIGRRSMVYPLAHWCGVLPESSILKVRQTVQRVERRSQAEE
jgi:NDP-sugar pyrophosphorylase family protein